MSAADFDARGFAIVGDVVPAAARETLLRVFAQLLATGAGNRNGLRHPAVRALAISPAVRTLVEPRLGDGAFAYRATLFDKTATANWMVAWHQDLMVPVRQRRDIPGFGPWSRKAGTWFVQPPAPALEQVVAVRIDLDGSDAERGALRVLPGTHRLGILPPARVAELARTIEPVTCTVPVGGALSMRPLLLHASSRALQPSHRRIVHLEFAGQRLLGRDQDPAGLAFDDGVG